MARGAKANTKGEYRTIGKTYDGVEVLAPKVKSKTFTAAEVRKAIAKALSDATGAPQKKSLAKSNAIRVQRRDDGQFEVKKAGAKRASAVRKTQGDAVARARELSSDEAPIVKRVRKSPAGKRGTWRKA